MVDRTEMLEGAEALLRVARAAVTPELAEPFVREAVRLLYLASWETR